jgi:hypothetical protein
MAFFIQYIILFYFTVMYKSKELKEPNDNILNHINCVVITMYEISMSYCHIFLMIL